MLPLRDAQNKEVDATSADVVNALYKTYSTQDAARTKAVLDWSKEWHKDKLVQPRSQEEKNKQQTLITKCLGAETQFRIFYQVR